MRNGRSNTSTGTRHVAPGSIVLDGAGLGANLALEVAAAHPELAGVIVESPVADPMSAIFEDARARMVPARLLVRDRYDLDAAAAGSVRVPVLWFAAVSGAAGDFAGGVRSVRRSQKDAGVGESRSKRDQQIEDAMTRWMDGLASR